VSKQLAAGSSVVAPCGTLGGIVVNFTVTATTVTAVKLSNVPATCNGAQVTATVTNPSGTSVGAGGPVAVSGGAATVSVSPTPAFASIAAVRLAVVGP
jgi:hypothetical protein